LPLTLNNAVVNLDMIGRNDANALVGAGTYYHPHLKPLVAESAHGRQLTVGSATMALCHGRTCRGLDVVVRPRAVSRGRLAFLYFGVGAHRLPSVYRHGREDPGAVLRRGEEPRH
jgi:hypothetical protein